MIPDIFAIAFVTILLLETVFVELASVAPGRDQGAGQRKQEDNAQDEVTRRGQKHLVVFAEKQIILCKDLLCIVSIVDPYIHGQKYVCTITLPKTAKQIQKIFNINGYK